MGIPDPERDPQFYAGVPVRRLVAFCVDIVIVLVLMLIAIFFGFLFTIFTAGLGGALAMALFTFTGFLYRWVLLFQRSATIGMLVTGIEVRDALGEKMTRETAFFHTAGYYLTFIFTPLLLIGWMLMATSPHRRAMHDLFMGAVVINRPT